MKQNETEMLKATGKLVIEVFDANGNTKDKREVDNLVVSVGKNFIASRVTGTTSAIMSNMAIGTGTATPVVGDTALGAENGRVALTSGTNNNNTVTYVSDFPAGVGTGAVTEAGVFNASTGGTMFCRTTFLVVNKGAADSMSITWVITIN